MIKQHLRNIFIILVLTLISTMLSCSEINEIEYTSESPERFEQFIITESVVDFSFYYPENCEVALLSPSDSGIYVGFDRSLDEEYWDGYSLSILVREKGIGQYRSASEKLEGFLDSAEKYLVSFNLEKQIKINIAGVQGEQIIYTSIAVPMLDGEHDVRSDTAAKSTAIYFDYGEYIFSIFMMSPIETYEKDYADFIRMLETFHFFD